MTTEGAGTLHAETDRSAISRTGATPTEDFDFSANGQCLAATKILDQDGAGPEILALHGLGETSTRHRIRYLLEPLAAQGHGSITFDFSGNGDSTGALRTSTLRGRRVEALGAAAYLDKAVAPVLLGTSMGAHLAASIVPEVRPRGLVLFCPAAYPGTAADQPFDGSLARPGNYPDSPAYAGLREFEGDLLLLVADHDKVVAPAVIEGYLANAGRARSVEVMRFDCDHFVHRWLPDQDARRDETVRAIARLLSAGPSNR